MCLTCAGFDCSEFLARCTTWFAVIFPFISTSGAVCWQLAGNDLSKLETLLSESQELNSLKHLNCWTINVPPKECISCVVIFYWVFILLTSTLISDVWLAQMRNTCCCTMSIIMALAELRPWIRVALLLVWCKHWTGMLMPAYCFTHACWSK